MPILFGGSFDPIHIGHILIARDSLEILAEDEVVFIPASRAPLKDSHGASAEDRLKMVEIATEREEGFGISDVEIRRGGTSYTVDTLRWFVQERGERPYLLLGSDSVLRLHLWKEPGEVVKLSKLAIVGRGYGPESVGAYLRERFPHLREGEDWVFLETRRVDVSATEIRERLAKGLSVYCMVPDKVLDYIRERRLYNGRDADRSRLR
ncbi:MAG TPA: nicotinate (nicotinamide) nucleotide adenylyltransferase [Aquifex aeolicus]|nr:nicotinate (nicotinamide) nucleotide adenylyltransferase [Aquifex aeolicus]